MKTLRPCNTRKSICAIALSTASDISSCSVAVRVVVVPQPIVTTKLIPTSAQAKANLERKPNLVVVCERFMEASWKFKGGEL